mmetsp:Transcript_15210/g.43507  ORF Transcript_15210/g.43507 Transcript_15210/m.43507 type:complete len:403 (-) Transcript_15210:844-2052(-)
MYAERGREARARDAVRGLRARIRARPSSHIGRGFGAAEHAGGEVLEPERLDDADASYPQRDRPVDERRGQTAEADLDLDSEPHQEHIAKAPVGVHVPFHALLHEPEVQRTQAPREDADDGAHRRGALLREDQPAVQEDLHVREALLLRQHRHLARAVPLIEVRDLAPRPPHVEVDDDLRHDVPHGGHAVHEVHAPELRHDRRQAPEEGRRARGRGQLQQGQEAGTEHVDELTDSQCVPPGLAPAAEQRAAVGLLLGRVVEERQEDGMAPNAALRHQAALGKHVPVLCHVVRIPASHGRCQHQTDGIARERHVAINRVGKASQLMQSGEERRDPDQHRLSQVVLEMADGRLPRRHVARGLICGQELIGESLEVVRVHLRVVVHDRDDDPGIVPRDVEVLFENP